VTLQSSAGGTSVTGNGGAAGTVSITGGAGGAVVTSTGTGGTGAAVTITAGAGGGANAVTGGAGGAASLIGGAGGNGSSASGAAGKVILTAGAAGTGGNVDGGNIKLTTGAGVGTGVVGYIEFGASGMFVAQSSGASTNPTFPSGWSNGTPKWLRCYDTVAAKALLIPVFVST
jgi:hypothetical protein